MKIGVRLFISSMIFAIVISTTYGFTTHDIIGVVFLGMMALALVVVAGYVIVAEREAHLASDEQTVSAKDVAGEELGAFTLESYWPILAATGVTSILLGVVFVPSLSFAFVLAGVALVAWTLRFLVREST